jgi:hypothetical protein
VNGDPPQVGVSAGDEHRAEALLGLHMASAPFFGMTAGSGEFYTLDRKVGHIGQTAGRSDIRY